MVIYFVEYLLKVYLPFKVFNPIPRDLLVVNHALGICYVKLSNITVDSHFDLEAKFTTGFPDTLCKVTTEKKKQIAELSSIFKWIHLYSSVHSFLFV